MIKNAAGGILPRVYYDLNLQNPLPFREIYDAYGHDRLEACNEYSMYGGMPAEKYTIQRPENVLKSESVYGGKS